MTSVLSLPRMIELAAALVLLAAGIWLYRRNKAADQNYGSQGAVILFVIAAIMGVHALGGFDYHPTKAEADYFKARSR
jgi:thiol:disulfide interchange protein